MGMKCFGSEKAHKAIMRAFGTRPMKDLVDYAASLDPARNV